MQRYLSFNTSHVTLYHLCLRTAMVIITFQYISCYSLSYHKRIGRYVVTGFQYISCYSLSNLLIMKRYCKNMFQYISCYSLSMTSKHYKYFQPKFQYISCYSLSRKYPWGNQREIGVSIHLMLLFILRQKTTDRTDGCFNTSHVTLYRRWTFQNRWQWTFQYISCYSLSKISRPWSAVQIPFQYISCYSLSNYDKLSDAWDYCFNTSHVTLYQSFRQKIKCFLVSFNTSHVTLYLIVNCYRLPSIMFQYISCYSLSVWSSLSFLKWFVSIHLMLLFIKLHLW